jgi:tetratricopeptide (TPR) repeat protein
MRILAFLMVVMGAAQARAEDLAKARLYFQAGVDAYDEAKYEVALREFQHAHALSHNPELYFNMAACEEHMNHFQAASLLLRQYVIEKPNADDRSKVEARIKVLDEREESIHRIEPEPVPRPKAEVVAPPPPPPPAPKKNYLGGFIALGVTGAFGIAAIATGAYTVSNHSSLASGCGMTDAGCTQSQRDGLHTTAVITDVFIGLTAAAAVATVVLFVLESRGSAPRTRAALHGLHAGWTF